MEDNNTLKYVVDENGQKHQLKEELGKGGQGAVWKTSDPNIVVKMKIDSVTGEPVVDDAEYEKYKAGLDEVRTLDLPEGIHVAKVASILQKPYCGYTMRMLSNMKSVKYWIRTFGGNIAAPEFFRDTGGLRYRLRFLSKAAGIFAKLNYHSVVYADLSPDNLFVSVDNQAGQVWLIDADNMRYFFNVSRQIMTPGYAAPEVDKGGLNTLESDEYTFAVLAHQILTLNSPFDGEMLSEIGDGWDNDAWDAPSEPSSNAENTEYIPWIYDPDDTRNAVTPGLGFSPDLVMTDKMKELFYRNFSVEGQKNPASRPSMREWFEELRRAENLVITCEHCRNTYFMKSQKREECPFCKKMRTRPVYYAQIVEQYDFDSIVDAENLSVDEFNKEGEFGISHLTKEEVDSIRQVGKRIFDDADGTYGFYNYQTDDLFALTDEEYTIGIKIEKGKYLVANLMTDTDIEMSSSTGKIGTLKAQTAEKFDKIDGLILTIPVSYGRKAIPDGEIHVVDDISVMKKRYIKFYKL